MPVSARRILDPFKHRIFTLSSLSQLLTHVRIFTWTPSPPDNPPQVRQLVKELVSKMLLLFLL